MDEIRDRFHGGRRQMLDAFAELSALARRAGACEDAITAAHGRFFDGNVEAKMAFRVAIVLAEVQQKGQSPES
jgi:hypothetical protein